MQYPPTVNITNVVQLKGKELLKPNKYPAIDENKTLTAKPALVISLKSIYTDFRESVFVVEFNLIGIVF